MCETSGVWFGCSMYQKPSKTICLGRAIQWVGCRAVGSQVGSSPFSYPFYPSHVHWPRDARRAKVITGSNTKVRPAPEVVSVSRACMLKGLKAHLWVPMVLVQNVKALRVTTWFQHGLAAKKSVRENQSILWSGCKNIQYMASSVTATTWHLLTTWLDFPRTFAGHRMFGLIRHKWIDGLSINRY